MEESSASELAVIPELVLPMMGVAVFLESNSLKDHRLISWDALLGDESRSLLRMEAIEIFSSSAMVRPSVAEMAGVCTSMRK